MSGLTMRDGDFVEVVGGPLDGCRMEWLPDTREGFTHRAGRRIYLYDYREINDPKGSHIPRSRYVFVRAINERKRKGKRKEG